MECAFCGKTGDLWPCETCDKLACDACHESERWSAEPHRCAECAFRMRANTLVDAFGPLECQFCGMRHPSYLAAFAHTVTEHLYKRHA